MTVELNWTNILLTWWLMGYPFALSVVLVRQVPKTNFRKLWEVASFLIAGIITVNLSWAAAFAALLSSIDGLVESYRDVNREEIRKHVVDDFFTRLAKNN